HFYLKEYAPNSQDWQDLRLAPLLATDFSDMPTSFVAVAEYDPLSDDGYLFTQKLEQAGIPNGRVAATWGAPPDTTPAARCWSFPPR
ncbi:alpha/beta hydrolase fold domain-containing protein, partial [Klebsiella pneumoniae]